MPYEYFWYAPTGELIEHQQQGNASYNSPYQFSARTFDALPNLVYMGARFYSPVFSIFTTVDPMAAYRSWISPYNYACLPLADSEQSGYAARPYGDVGYWAGGAR